MKNVLLIAFLLIGMTSFSQTSKTFDNLVVYAGLPYGFGVEVGSSSNIKEAKHNLGYFLGVNSEFGEYTDKGVDLMFYGKGVYSLNKYVGISALGGLEDFNSLEFGVGLRGTIPSDNLNIIIEPMWRTNGSRVNIGFSINL